MGSLLPLSFILIGRQGQEVSCYGMLLVSSVACVFVSSSVRCSGSHLLSPYVTLILWACGICWYLLDVAHDALIGEKEHYTLYRFIQYSPMVWFNPLDPTFQFFVQVHMCIIPIPHTAPNPSTTQQTFLSILFVDADDEVHIQCFKR